MWSSGMRRYLHQLPAKLIDHTHANFSVKARWKPPTSDSGKVWHLNCFAGVWQGTWQDNLGGAHRIESNGNPVGVRKKCQHTRTHTGKKCSLSVMPKGCLIKTYLPWCILIFNISSTLHKRSLKILETYRKFFAIFFIFYFFQIWRYILFLSAQKRHKEVTSLWPWKLG